jgi:hypothetical protein
MSKPTKQFLKFIETINDYRDYEAFEGYINEVLEENIKRFQKEIKKFGVNWVFFETIKQFYCSPFRKHFLWGKGLDEIHGYILTRIIRRYENFYGVKELFQEIMLEVESLRESGKFPPKEDSLINIGRIPAQMYITSDGYYAEDLSTKVLHDIDLSKVRICICGNYFWAFRKDKFTCSPECGNRVRQQKFLNDSERRKEYNAKRLQYYHENKDEMKKRKLKGANKKNGTL